MSADPVTIASLTIQGISSAALVGVFYRLGKINGVVGVIKTHCPLLKGGQCENGQEKDTTGSTLRSSVENKGESDA